MDQKKAGHIFKEVLVVIYNGLYLILSAWAFTRIPDEGVNLGSLICHTSICNSPFSLFLRNHS